MDTIQDREAGRDGTPGSGSDADLTESNIDLKAFTREPLTGEQSTQEGTETATVEIVAVADKPILSATRVR